MIDQEMDFTDAKLLRKRAEVKLNAAKEMSGLTSDGTDDKRLLHELQVHQIELEMQNEELRQAYSIAEAALKKYTLIYDFAPLGCFTLNADGIICELNFSGAEILGDKRITLLDSSFRLFVDVESKNDFDEFFDKVLKGEAKESCYIKLDVGENPPCLVYIEGVVAEEDNQYLLSVIDISGLKMPE